MYTIYTIPGSCSSGITVLLEKLKVEYTAIKREDIDNYSEIVPTNQVPALKTEEGQIITEGGAIVLYLLEKHGADLQPKNLSQKAEFYKWLFFDYATLHPAYAKVFAVSKKIDIDNKEEVLQLLADDISKLWAILDAELKNKQFILGDEPTIVDYLATIYSSWGNYFPNVRVTLGNNVQRLVDEISNLPEFQSAYAKENAQFKKASTL